ncbi:thymidine phosphorylase [Palleronia aestuarii]|uniref:thymidine phosphorylase n=1 Tax=Palleronia aestuarii TaxID=568105 RepID=A0A2W7NEV2_9RHOB|nr:thymidine phosphorylase [Palleronia aestuarii]PZX15254.1 thymidine phosphorylase [Palleronia aestuarii]
MIELLGDLRAGRTPGPDALAAFARGLADGSISDAQAGAFAMGVCRGPGLGAEGRAMLTQAMAESGETLRWDVPGPVLDKHSTGGIGDPVSLVLAPLLAAAGCYVPMISGRGLGHTGGTLDKLEAIPGLSTEQDGTAFRRVVAEVGCAIVAANAEIAPADRRLYAIRDITATVDQIDLITASILSKKLAAGLQALVLDVKVGTGAFMLTREEAEALGRALVETSRAAGCPATALLTAMDGPLAPSVGNAVEIRAVMEVLTGQATGTPLEEVALALGAELIVLAMPHRMTTDVREELIEKLRSGAAADRFARMVATFGGPRDFAATWDTDLPTAPVIRDVTSTTDGTLVAVDGRRLGEAVLRLGGGRLRQGNAIDPAVGLADVAQLGAPVTRGVPLARIHARTEAEADRAEETVRAALTVRMEAMETPPLILERVA